MKDQYVGDIGDFEKYSVLRALQHASRLPLVVCWMLTAQDATGEGGKTAYLSRPERYRYLDPHVFDGLKELVRHDRRSTAAVEAAGVVHPAVFIRDQLLDDIDSRRALFEAVARGAGGSPSLVFLDPDIGLAGTSMRKGAKRSSMYLFHDEAAALFDAGHSLVIYQHFAREQRPEFLARAFSRMRAACDPPEQFAVYSGRVAFLVASHADVAGAMRAAGESFAARWKGLLSFAAEGDLAPAPDGHRGREIVLEVLGYPPTKNEAKSLLSEGHSQSTRVGALLQQAHRALSAGAVPLAAERIGVELVVRGPADAPSDATNYLGGIGDVLQDKARRGALDHLGALATVALFADDRQIREVIYREERAPEPSYRLRFWPLPKPSSRD